MTGLLPRETPFYWYRFAELPGLTTRSSQTLSICSSAQIIRSVRYCRARQDVSQLRITDEIPQCFEMTGSDDIREFAAALLLLPKIEQ